MMIMQAQACFYEKAVADRPKTNMKASLIARLAAQVGEAGTYILLTLVMSLLISSVLLIHIFYRLRSTI